MGSVPLLMRYGFEERRKCVRAVSGTVLSIAGYTTDLNSSDFQVSRLTSATGTHASQTPVPPLCDHRGLEKRSWCPCLFSPTVSFSLPRDFSFFPIMLAVKV